MSLGDYKIKRSWVRRLSSKKSLLTNEIAQNFKPLLRSNGNIVQATSFAGIFEINRFGQKKWSHKVEFGVSGAGSTYRNFVFFGSLDKKIHAYDMKTKSLLWSTELEGAVSAISDFSNGKIFVLTDNGSLYAIKAAEGAIDWTVSNPPRKLLKIYGGAKPVIFGSQIIAGFPNGKVLSLSQSNGKARWTNQLQGSQKHEDIDFLSLSGTDVLIAGVFDEALYRLDLKTGGILWQAFEKPVSETTTYEDSIYFSGAEGDLISLKLSSGNLVSKENIFSGLGGKPLFLKGKIVVSDSKGPLRVVDRDTGAILTSYGLISPVSSGMTLDKSKAKFFLMSDKGYLYSFGLQEKSKAH